MRWGSILSLIPLLLVMQCHSHDKVVFARLLQSRGPFFFTLNTSTSVAWYIRALRVSVQFSRSVVSNSLQPHESQRARPPYPSPTPRVYPNPCPYSWWCHPAISSSVVPFSCPQFLPASESCPMSQLFTWGDRSTGVSALASFLPKNTQDWSPLE